MQVQVKRSSVQCKGNHCLIGGIFRSRAILTSQVHDRECGGAFRYPGELYCVGEADVQFPRSSGERVVARGQYSSANWGDSKVDWKVLRVLTLVMAIFSEFQQIEQPILPPQPEFSIAFASLYLGREHWNG